jgi:hypothetical protein
MAKKKKITKTTVKRKPLKTNKRIANNDVLAVLEHLVNNTITSRSAGLSRLLNLDKDINYECGYPDTIDIADYKAMYDREGVGTRVVRLLPEESWAMLPIVEQNQKIEETDFEKQWKEIEKKYHLFHYLQRIDVLSGIGRFGLLLLGINDGKQLYQPVNGINQVTGEKVGNSVYELTYVRPFDESVVAIKEKEADVSSPRYGLPTKYSISFKNNTLAGTSISTKVVHWTRVLHIADNREVSEVYGVPRMKPVYNRLLDLRKIVAGSGEMFWKGGFPGMGFKLDSNTSLSADDLTTLREQVKDYQDGLQRWMALQGIEIQELKPQIEDPEPHIKAQLQYIAATLGIPYRIFMGSEAAHLASTEDKDTWNKRLQRRQEDYVSPMIIRQLIDRLIIFGVLPEVEEYFINWPDLNALGEKEKAEIAVKRTEALSKYVGGNVNEFVPNKEFLTIIMEMSEEDAEVIIKAKEKEFKEEDDLIKEGETEIDEDVNVEEEDTVME